TNGHILRPGETKSAQHVDRRLSHVECQKYSHQTIDQKTSTKILWTLQNPGKNRNPIISTRTRSSLENTQRLSRFSPQTIQVLIRSTEDTNPPTARRNRGRKRI